MRRKAMTMGLALVAGLLFAPGARAQVPQAAGTQATTAQAPRAPARPPSSAAEPPAPAPLRGINAGVPVAPTATQPAPAEPPDDDAHAHAHGAPPGANGIFEPPPDTTDEDDHLPAGTIAITILDADNRPQPSTNVTLGIMHQSVAKGESREHKSGDTNAIGALQFTGLGTGTGVAYRVTVVQDGATFAAMPFQLPLGKGMRVALHVYPVTRNINDARIVMRTIMYAEMKEDRVQLQQVITVFNAGRVAWIPDNVVLGLPENYAAFQGVQAMSDTGMEAIEKRGARLKGTFGPGRHDVEFRWQLPYGGDKDISIDESLPPHVAVARVMAAASQQMRLVVDGFPNAESVKDNQGQNVLITERQMNPQDPPLTRIHVELRDLPTEGPGKWLATAFSSVFVIAGIAMAVTTARPAKKARKKDGADTKAERAELLTELEDLERAHRAGEIGPKTYERARREIIDALARTLAVKSDVKAKA